MKQLISIAIATSLLLTACRIEPPLKLSEDPRDVTTDVPIVITEMEVLWDVNVDWRNEWYYGWDEQDVQMWGELDSQYPDPTNFEVRRYFLGEMADGQTQGYDKFTVWGNSFRRRYQYGYYNMLLWSNIDSPDGTQTVIINESNTENIIASTSRARVSRTVERSRAVNTHNQPEIFYASHVENFYISRDIKDYDYYNEVERVWVKLLHTQLDPVVYIYLVQVILHNNNARIKNVAAESLISGLADGVSLHTGVTSGIDANITFDMRMKSDLDYQGETVDIIGGKLTTFGLCSMEPWSASRGPQSATRLDLDNTLWLTLLTRGDKELVYAADVTDQMRAHVHGGVITVHIDVDDIDFPGGSGGSPSGFVPWVDDYDEEEYEFTI